MSVNFKPYPTRPRMQEIVPAGKKETAEIIHFELVSDIRLELDTMRYIRDGCSFMVARPGRYVKLIADKALQMSDTDMEWRTNGKFLYAATGDVFIAGLGIGLVIVPLLNKPGSEA